MKSIPKIENNLTNRTMWSPGASTVLLNIWEVKILIFILNWKEKDLEFSKGFEKGALHSGPWYS